jgi:hypothetical protein
MRARAAPPDPSWAALRAHSGRLFRRARRHVWMVFGLAALATLAALGLAARRPIRQTATVVLRMTEDAKAPLRLQWTDRTLRGHVSDVALSQTSLLALIDRHRLFRRAPGSRERIDPILAVDLLRERITVEVVQNHAIALVDRDNRPRSAHVRISFQDSDPQRAVKVARELGELVVAVGRSQQREQAEVAVRRASAEVQAARGALEGLQLQAAGSGLAAFQARSSADVPGLSQSLQAARGRLDRAYEDLARAEQRVRGDLDRSALEVELLETVPSPPPWPVGKRLAVVAASASLFCFPLAALMVGAWDRRIYTVEDVRHLGIRCLGRLGLTKGGA